MYIGRNNIGVVGLSKLAKNFVYIPHLLHLNLGNIDLNIVRNTYFRGSELGGDRYSDSSRKLKIFP